MTLHEHDRDLVMALAEGSLDAAAEERAHAEIAACTECGEELALQMAALDALGSAPTVIMTAAESSQLHRQLDTALDHQRIAPAPAPAEKRRSYWAPVFSVAAVLLALVLLAPTLELLGGGSDDSADLASAGVEAEESAPQNALVEEAAPGTADREALPTDEADDELAEEPSAGADATDDTIEAAGVATTAAPAADSQEALAQPLAELDELVESYADPAEARAGVAEQWKLSFEPALENEDECVQQGLLYLEELLGSLATGSYELGKVVLMEGEEPATITVHDLGTNSIVLAHLAETCQVLLQGP